MGLALPKEFEVVRVGGLRTVRCKFCGAHANRSIVTHIKKYHPQEWIKMVDDFRHLRSQGLSSKKIMWQYKGAFSWTVIERCLAEKGVLPPLQRRPIDVIEPPEFKLQETSLWSFGSRGRWAVHDSTYRGNWAPEVPRNLILRYTKAGDLVLDPFVGGGTTAIEALLTGRNFVGVDINEGALRLSRAKLRRLRDKARRTRGLRALKSSVRLVRRDARALEGVAEQGTVALACLHPPYLDIIEYTRTNPSDLSTITDPNRFIREMRKIILEVWRLLAPGGRLALLIGDVRRKGQLIPLGMMTLGVLMESFSLEDIAMKVQHNCSSSHFYKKPSFMRIAHEYLFIVRKEAKESRGVR